MLMCCITTVKNSLKRSGSYADSADCLKKQKQQLYILSIMMTNAFSTPEQSH